VNSTLFSQKYLSLVLDEAHEFRNIGAKHSAALAIVGQATLPLIMTATPLLTSTKVYLGPAILSFYARLPFLGHRGHGTTCRNSAFP